MLFVTVGAFVFLTFIIAASIWTSLLTSHYRSTTRIKIESHGYVPAGINFAQDAAAMIQSELILDPVIDNLDLSHAWGVKYGAQEFNKFDESRRAERRDEDNYAPLKSSESREILKRLLEVHPIPNTSLVEISVTSDNSSEAAFIANGIAERYREYVQKLAGERLSANLKLVQDQLKVEGKELKPSEEVVDRLVKVADGPHVVIVDKAVPAVNALPPSRMKMGVTAGLFLAVVIGGLVALPAIVRGWKRVQDKIRAADSAKNFA